MELRVENVNEAFQENFIGSQLPSFLPPNPLSILQSSESNFSKAPIITELCSPVVSFPLQFSQHPLPLQLSQHAQPVQPWLP